MESLIGVIIGGVISLASVYWTLKRNQEIHEDNLREERRKKKEEREFSAKQAALLSASEALTRFIGYYITLPDRILPSDGTVAEEIIELSVACDRLHFYCSLETIEKSAHLVQVLNEAFAETIKAKMPSGFIAGDLQALDIGISGIEKMNTRIQDELKVILQSGVQDPLLVSHREQLAKNFEIISDMHGKRVELIKRKYIETEKCRDVVLGNLKAIYESSKEVLMLARQELSFPIDQERYETIMDERSESIGRTTGELLTEIRKQMTERMQ